MPTLRLLVPKVGFEPTRPFGTLRPERSASAVPPLRPFSSPEAPADALMVGDTGLEPVASCV